MRPTFTKQKAADAVAKATGERDAIRANLLDLDGSFGKRLLEGAALTGITRQRAVVALLSRRDELRGLLDAYQAKAARLGAAEDPHLAARYAQARELLWTAPCDLTAVASAVNGYQHAVLAIGARQR
jgi:hypothetical protein